MEPQVYVIAHSWHLLSTCEIAEMWGLKRGWRRIDVDNPATYMGVILTGSIVISGAPPECMNGERPELPLPMTNKEARRAALYLFGTDGRERGVEAFEAEERRLEWMAQREQRIKDERAALLAKLLKADRRLKKMKDSS